MHSSSCNYHCDLMNLEIIGSSCCATDLQSRSSFSLVISFLSRVRAHPILLVVSHHWCDSTCCGEVVYTILEIRTPLLSTRRCTELSNREPDGRRNGARLLLFHDRFALVKKIAFFPLLPTKSQKNKK
jgi:hypothetical protein